MLGDRFLSFTTSLEAIAKEMKEIKTFLDPAYLPLGELPESYSTLKKAFLLPEWINVLKIQKNNFMPRLHQWKMPTSALSSSLTVSYLVLS